MGTCKLHFISAKQIMEVQTQTKCYNMYKIWTFIYFRKYIRKKRYVENTSRLTTIQFSSIFFINTLKSSLKLEPSVPLAQPKQTCILTNNCIETSVYYNIDITCKVLDNILKYYHLSIKKIINKFQPPLIVCHTDLPTITYYFTVI